jgi:hypothetical protein
MKAVLRKKIKGRVKGMTWLFLIVGALLVFGLYDLSRVFWLIRHDLHDIRCSINTVGQSATQSAQG